MKARLVGSVLFTQQGQGRKRLAGLGCVGPRALDNSRGLWKHEQPATSGRQQRSVSYKHMDTCELEVMFHTIPISARRRKFWTGVPGLQWNIQCTTTPVFPVIMDHGAILITRRAASITQHCVDATETRRQTVGRQVVSIQRHVGR